MTILTTSIEQYTGGSSKYKKLRQTQEIKKTTTTYDKIQHPFMIRTLYKFGIEKNFLTW